MAGWHGFSSGGHFTAVGVQVRARLGYHTGAMCIPRRVKKPLFGMLWNAWKWGQGVQNLCFNQYGSLW